MAGTSASEPVVARSCEHCATALSQRASVQAQLAVLQADASRVAALQELCDKQQAALERHSKLRVRARALKSSCSQTAAVSHSLLLAIPQREVLAGADGTDKERRRVSAATQPLRARVRPWLSLQAQWPRCDTSFVRVPGAGQHDAQIDKLAGILADKDRQIEALKTRERFVGRR